MHKSIDRIDCLLFGAIAGILYALLASWLQRNFRTVLALLDGRPPCYFDLQCVGERDEHGTLI